MKRSGCIHCGTPLRRGSGPEGFCCAGCEQVHGLIQKDGLEAFYALQDQTGRPVESLAGAEPADGAALRRLQTEVERRGDSGTARLRVAGMTCVGCVWLVERIASRMAGCRAARASLQERVLELSWEPGRFDLVALAGELRRFGYGLSPDGPGGWRFSGMAWRVLLCGALAANAVWLEHLLRSGVLDASVAGLFRMLAVSVVFLSLFAGAGLFLAPALSALRMRVAHHDLPVAAGLSLLSLVLLAEAGSEAGGIARWSLLPVVVWILLAGRWLQQGLWRKLRGWRFAGVVMDERPAIRWRRVLFWQCGILALASLILFVALSAGGGWLAGLERVASLLLAPALFPLAAVARHGWPRGWMQAGISLAWLGLSACVFFNWPAPAGALFGALSGACLLGSILLLPAKCREDFAGWNKESRKAGISNR